MNLNEAIPTFNPPSGTVFKGTLSLSISDTTHGATIYFTTDGSGPTTASTKYRGPLTISSTTTIYAIAAGPGDSISDAASATYTEKPCNLVSPDRGNNVYAFDGDSLTVGWSGVFPIHPWTDDVLVPNGFTTYNVAHGGWQISDMEEAAPTELDPRLNSKGLWNVVWVMGGTNDEVYVDVRATISRLVKFSSDRHKAGWKVIVVTLPSRRKGDGFKHEFNDYLRANWPSFADQIVDLGSIPQIGADFAYRERKYFLPDGIHLTQAGYAYFSQGAADALNRLLATPSCDPLGQGTSIGGAPMTEIRSNNPMLGRLISGEQIVPVRRSANPMKAIHFAGHLAMPSNEDAHHTQISLPRSAANLSSPCQIESRQWTENAIRCVD